MLIWEGATMPSGKTKPTTGADVTAKARSKLPVLAPLALEAVKKIDVIFDIEREINGLSVEECLSARRSRIVPLVAGLEDWMRAERARLLPPCRSRQSDGLHAQALGRLHVLSR